MTKNIKHRKLVSGFSLVEILVVMAIISVLLAIAIPAILAARIHAIETASASSAHNLSVAVFTYASDNSNSCPSGATSTDVFNTLYAGRYLQSGREVYLNSNNGKTPYTGTSATITISAANNCWDYTEVSSTQGVYGSPVGLPLFISETSSTPTITSGVVNATVTGSSTWGLDGVTVGYADQSSKFCHATSAGIVPITTVDFQVPAGSTYTVVAP